MGFWSMLKCLGWFLFLWSIPTSETRSALGEFTTSCKASPRGFSTAKATITCLFDKIISGNVITVERSGLHKNGVDNVQETVVQCFPVPTQDMDCVEEKGYSFTRAGDTTLTIEVDEDDGAWKYECHVVSRKNTVGFCFFPPTVPPKITSLLLEKHQLSEGVEVNSSLQVVCLWDKGNPPVTARLLDRHGVELEGSIYSSGQIIYTFPSVGCQDAGLIRCEAPGASHNKTVTLKVKSTPEMSTNYKTPIITEPGKSLDQELEVCAHTSDLKSCLMTQSTRTSRDRPGREISRNLLVVNENTRSSSFCNLTGTPPDLTLTVRLDNVRKEDEGQWTLTLTNDMGSGHVDFTILIKRAPEFQNSINMTAAAGENIQLKFPVKSHTTHITNCQLVRSDGGEQSFWTRAAGFGLNCLSFVTLTGTPPDLVLTVRLDNVRKQDEGQWRLELTNEAGVGHMNFSLHIELEVSAEHQMPTLTIVATTVPSMLCLVMVIVITTICIKRANRSSKAIVTVRDESIALEIREDRANRTVSTVSQASVNVYHEIPDDIPDEVGESASDGYLVPSPVENTAYGLEPIETTPIYQNELPLEPEQEGIAAAAAAADLPPGDVQNPAASRADVDGADYVITG